MSDSEIKSLPLMRRRKLLGYLIPAVNIPLLLYNLYQTFIHFQQGMEIGTQMFWEDLLLLASNVFLTLAIPRFFPVYTSKYSLEKEGLKIKRLLRRTATIPYKDIDRVEVYIRTEEEISEDAREYATDQSALLRKSGFKFIDYTNAEDNIMNLFVGKSVYMISPARPKALLKKLKRRNKGLTARIIELNSRGKRIRDLT